MRRVTSRLVEAAFSKPCRMHCGSAQARGSGRHRLRRLYLYSIALLLFWASIANAEDGYRLWLRYDQLPPSAAAGYRSQITSFVIDGDSPSFQVIGDELSNGLSGLLGKSIPRADKIDRDGAVIVMTLKSKLAAELNWRRQLESLGPEGFRIATTRLGGHSVIVIASAGETGANGSDASARVIRPLPMRQRALPRSYAQLRPERVGRDTLQG